MSESPFLAGKLCLSWAPCPAQQQAFASKRARVWPANISLFHGNEEVFMWHTKSALKSLLYRNRSCGRGRQTGVIHPTQALLPLALLVLGVTKPITPAHSQQAQIHGAGHADDGAAENHPVSLPLSTFFKK